MVASVSGDDERFGIPTLRKAAGHREHDAIAKGDDGLHHVALRVVTLGDLAAALEQIGVKQLVHEAEIDHFVRDPCFVTMPSGEWQLTGVVLGPVVETHRRDDVMMLLRPMQGRHGVGSAREQDHHFASFVHRRGFNPVSKVRRGRDGALHR